ncbi:protein trichome birefringence-like 36 [Malania oleifera]|uniref:protein trichome birefringence-like 36 n=1 Tax=Malania oleifera TaxID=397392 RepID=UPI0025ADDA0F|nr:protein trichome birefringence-like 36 [Malania oleifera]
MPPLHASSTSSMAILPSQPSSSFSLLPLLLFFFVLLCLSNVNSSSASGLDEEVHAVQARRYSRQTCNLSAGKWVYDSSYPLYDRTCPYLTTAVDCRQNGRPDSGYEKWRWRPSGCSLPRFNALRFLGSMRGKRIVLVGDSIMRNQWESLVCLVQGVIPTHRKSVTFRGPSMAFHASDYKTTIVFCWAPLLVELKKEREKGRVLHLDQIEANARHWRGADVLVFDSAHWWTHSNQETSWDYYMEGNKIYNRNLNPMIAYGKGLTTWANWVDSNLNPHQTRVIFRSISPTHNRENGRKCYNQREPMAFLGHRHHVPAQMHVLQSVLRRMKFPVYLQDITTMSAYRRDGHPSVYSKRIGYEEKRHQNQISSATDCSHWCLPGVPDTWNEMLSAILMA